VHCLPFPYLNSPESLQSDFGTIQGPPVDCINGVAAARKKHQFSRSSKHHFAGSGLRTEQTLNSIDERT
jgi:hypothetical protein